jgi:hypothetical protein
MRRMTKLGDVLGRATLHAALVGATGSGVAWLAAYLGPDQMLCIETRTLALIGTGTAIAARVFGILIRKAK